MNILVLAAHPDDEVLGAGGTMAKWVRTGHHVATAFLTDGVGSRGPDREAVNRRRTASTKAAALLGTTIADFGAFPDNRLDAVPLLEIVQAIERIKRTFQPDLVYTHFWGDLNIDHRRAFEAVLTAFRPQPGEKCQGIYCFEVASATEWGSPENVFRPNHYVELSGADVEKATRAYEAYDEEVRAEPHARSVEALRMRRMLRGREVGLPWAEAMMVAREISRLPANGDATVKAST